jgi:hypothetical protein
MIDEGLIFGVHISPDIRWVERVVSYIVELGDAWANLLNTRLRRP